jgi:hypothetical protein
MKALKTLWIAAAAMLAGGFVWSSQPAVAQVNQLDADMNIIPDKTVKTDDGIRITVCLIGIPHTSNRIDSVDLVVNKAIYPATDIDGVDFKRYFQFEDEGVVTVEIDFPFKAKLPKNSTLKFHTVKGDITSPARQ